MKQSNKVDKYIQYSGAIEFIQAQKIHGPYVVIKNRPEDGNQTHYLLPIDVWDNCIFTGSEPDDDLSCISYKKLLEFTWQDGTTCGTIKK